MSLPNLPDLPEQSFKEPILPKKEIPKKKPNPKVKKALKQKEPKEQSKLKENGKPKIPKTEYDSEGRPMLMIDLDDIGLNEEISRFFD